MPRCYLSTNDNPYDPEDDFQSWYNWDMTHGYNSASILNRIHADVEILSDEENEIAMEKAIDSFINADPLSLFKKIVKQ